MNTCTRNSQTSCTLWRAALFLVIAFSFMSLGTRAEDTVEQAVGVVKNSQYYVEMYRDEKKYLYTVKSTQGKLLAHKISEQEFRQKFPELYQFVQHSMSGSDKAQ